MKRNRIINVVLILFAVVVISCKENVALEYENAPALYFVRESSGQRDSVMHSFVMVQGDAPDTVWVEVQTMGFLSDVNRPVRFKQTNVYHADTAKYVARPGIHYVAFDDPGLLEHYYVPANKVRTKIPVVMLRDRSLDTMTVNLMFTIEENEYFRKGIPTMTDFKISTTASYAKPALWDTRWGPYVFGKSWGPVKMKFIVDVTGIVTWDVFPSDFAYFNYLNAWVTSELNKYNAAHPDAPLSEANETKVTFAS